MFILIDSLLHHIQCRCGLSGDVLHLIIHFKISINSIFTSHMTRKKNSVDMKFDTILCVKGLIMFNVAQQVLRALEWNRGRCNKFRGLIAGQTVISGPQTLNGLVEWWFYWNWIYVSVEPFSLSHGKCLSVRMRCANGRHRAITKNKNFNCRLISIKKLSNKFNLAVQLLEFCEFLLLHGPHWNDNLVFFCSFYHFASSHHGWNINFYSIFSLEGYKREKTEFLILVVIITQRRYCPETELIFIWLQG